MLHFSLQGYYFHLVLNVKQIGITYFKINVAHIFVVVEQQTFY